MNDKVNYEKINDILSAFEYLEVKKSKGKKFNFPIYLTEQMAEKPIEELDLKQRASNCLRRERIFTIGQLCKAIRCNADLARIRNCGLTSAAEIMESLFVYQYNVLDDDGKKQFILKVIEMNTN